MPRLLILVASTRPQRAGKHVADWFIELARGDGRFEIDVADLAEVDLPFLDEPEPASTGRYVHEHTFRWSRRVDSADAFVFVMPEYNHGYSAPLKNAIDFLYREWQDKPVAFVSYGGIAGGTRAVQMMKQVVTTLKMLPVKEPVVIPFVARRLTPEGFESDDQLDASARLLLDETARYSDALGTLRERRAS